MTSATSVLTSSRAASLIAALWAQVAYRSVHASITSSWGPISTALTAADHSSLPMFVIAQDDTTSAPRRNSARAARTSWPSLKMFAVTGVSSPTTAFAGRP